MSTRARSSRLTHGHAQNGVATPEHCAWVQMRYRCRKAAQSAEPGARIPRVCEAWDRSFEAFLADVGQKPSSAHILHLKDPHGDYTPENCGWKLKAGIHRSGRTVSRYIEVDGRRVSVVEAAAAHGLRVDTLRWRLAQGKSPQEALAPARFYGGTRSAQMPAHSSASRGGQA